MSDEPLANPGDQPRPAETLDARAERESPVVEPEPVVPESTLAAAKPVPSEPDASAGSPATPLAPGRGSPAPEPTTVSAQPPEAAELVEALEAEAFAVVEGLIQDLPGEVDPVGMMGMLHNRLDDTDEAVEYWQQCVKRDPRRADAYGAMGMIALRKQEYQKAVDLMQKALKLNPALRGARYVLADALICLNNSQEAVAVLREEIKASPEDTMVLCMLGKAQRQLGEYQEAQQSYRRAVDIDANCTQAYYGLATVCARLRQTDQARQYMEKFRRLKAKEDKAHKGRRAEYTDVTWARRVVVLTHTEAGRVYFGHGYLWKAEQHLQRAADLDANDAACRQELVPLYERTGQHRRAVEVCEQVRRIEPEDAQWHALAGGLLARIGEIDAARAALARAIELDRDKAEYRRLYQRIQKSP